MYSDNPHLWGPSVQSDLTDTLSTRSDEISARGEKEVSPMDQGISLSVAVERWLVFSSGRWSAKTVLNVRSIMGRLMLTVGADLLAADLEDGHIQDLWVAMRPGPGWAHYVGAFLRGLCRWLQRRGILRVDPSMAWPNVAHDPVGVFRTVTREEEERILPELSLPLRRYVVLGIGTGLRRGTIFASRWAWVDPTWTLNVPPAAMKNRRPLSLPLSARVREALGIRGAPEDPLIQGLPHPNDMNRRLRSAAVRAGMDPKNLSTHQLRKSWVERAHDTGATREEVQLMQGWASSSVLLDHYWPRVSAARSREIFERI